LGKLACCAVAFLVLLLIGTNLRFETAHASTRFNGIITQDTVWTQAGSPYDLTGPVAVNQHVTLTIEAGVTVNMNNHYMQVNGTLIARGTQTNPITFKDGLIAFTQRSEGWNEQTSQGSIIEYATFPGYTGDGSYTYPAQITVEGTTPKLSYLSEVYSMSISSSGGSQTINNDIIGKLTVDCGSQTISGNNIGVATISGSQTIINNNINQAEIRGTQTISHNTIGGLTSTNAKIISYNTIRGLSTSSPLILNNIIGQVHTYGSNELTIDADHAIIANNIISLGLAVSGNSPIVWNNTISFLPSRNEHEAIPVLGIYSSGTAIVCNNRVTGGSISVPDFASLGQRPSHGPFYTYYGIGVYGSAFVSRNIVSNCSEASIVVDCDGSTIEANTLTDKGFLLQNTNNIVRNNNIEGGLNLQSSDDFDAADNWWGTTDTQAIDAAIHDGNDDFNLGKVNYTPFLNQPNSQAMPDPNAPVPTSIPTLAPSPPPTQTPTDTSQPHSTDSGNTQLPHVNFLQVALITLVVCAVAVVAAFALLKRRRQSTATLDMGYPNLPPPPDSTVQVLNVLFSIRLQIAVLCKNL
jgi:hypothetical protein